MRITRLNFDASSSTTPRTTSSWCFSPTTSICAQTVCELYHCRWQVELFFKWIKQHLRIKAFFGTSENAVKTQVWIAIAVYVLVAVVKKRLNLDASLYTILQILSLTLFEKMPLDQVLANIEPEEEIVKNSDQLKSIHMISGHY